MITNCGHCGKEISVRPHRLTNGKIVCCSYLCSARRRVAVGTLGTTRITDVQIKRMEKAYKRSEKSLDQIGSEIGVSRSAIHDYAKARKWKRFKRVTSVRTQYRNAAANMVGRKLKKGEHVHHIDGLQTNNKPSNLHVFPSPKEHSDSHGSLESAAFSLFRRGLIKFSRKVGRYYVSK